QWQRLNIDPQSNLMVALRDASGNPVKAQTVGDGVDAASIGLLATAHGVLYNGTTSDRERANVNATLLASAARTSTTSVSDQTNYNGVGVLVWLDVTAASGSGGLQVVIEGKDPVSGNYVQLNDTPTAVTATGTKLYLLYPDAATAEGGVTHFTAG